MGQCYSSPAQQSHEFLQPVCCQSDRGQEYHEYAVAPLAVGGVYRSSEQGAWAYTPANEQDSSFVVAPRAANRVQQLQLCDIGDVGALVAWSEKHLDSRQDTNVHLPEDTAHEQILSLWDRQASSNPVVFPKAHTDFVIAQVAKIDAVCDEMQQLEPQLNHNNGQLMPGQEVPRRRFAGLWRWLSKIGLPSVSIAVRICPTLNIAMFGGAVATGNGTARGGNLTWESQSRATLGKLRHCEQQLQKMERTINMLISDAGVVPKLRQLSKDCRTVEENCGGPVQTTAPPGPAPPGPAPAPASAQSPARSPEQCPAPTPDLMQQSAQQYPNLTPSATAKADLARASSAWNQPVQPHPGRRNVVIIGECGEGKSFVVERITGVSGLSSAAHESFTRAAQPIITEDERLMIIDTPGTNPMDEPLLHNLQVAHAFSYGPVSLLCVVIKAQPRIDTTVSRIKKGVESWDFDGLLTAWITHMDQVTWDQNEVKRHIETRLGIDKVMFSSNISSGHDLSQQLLNLAAGVNPMEIHISSSNFLRYFNLPDDNVKVMQSIRKEVGKYQQSLQTFKTALAVTAQQEKPEAVRDLVFEFHAVMQEEIPKAQQRLFDKHDFSTMFTVVECSYVANLAKQLKHELLQVRIMMKAYQQDNGNLNLRRCPHCNLIWAKFIGCDGVTTCGQAHSASEMDGGRTHMTKWSFNISDGVLVNFQRNGEAQISRVARSGDGKRKGCGKQITWSEMSPVCKDDRIAGDSMTVREFLAGVEETHEPTTEDIEVIQSQYVRSVDMFLRDAYSNMNKAVPIAAKEFGKQERHASRLGLLTRRLGSGLGGS